jgi:Asp-tRNA(Asn)/Glu-tRNA(Gln) amidotransferase A subunit family amidase
MSLYELGLVEAMAAVVAGDFTAAEYVNSCLVRTRAVEPQLGAFIHFDEDAVRRATAMPARGPLGGMPVGIKDIIATRGVPTEMGSAAFGGHVPEQSAWAVDALADAGAVMFGKTVTTEFAWRQAGKTRNPWNLAHTPGGSSSGSAAAVAAGCVPVALGTQTLGSVVRPAAFCGVVGYKPSYGSIPRSGVYELAHSLDHVGILARNVIDAAFVASLLTASDGLDFPRLPAPAPVWPVEKAAKPPRIVVLRTSMWERLSGEQQALIERTADQLAAAGAAVTWMEWPDLFSTSWAVAQTLCDAEGAAVNEHLTHEKPPRISQPSLDLVARGKAVPVLDYIQALKDQQTLTRAFAAYMEPFDAVLTAPAFGEAPLGLDATGDAAFCTPFTLFGAPAISLPAALSANGLPLGVQLASPWGRDRTLLETALWVESQLAWGTRFPMMD